MNSPQTDHRAPYDFFCVYRVPNVEVQREFEQRVAASGWYEYFEQVNVSGDANDFEAVLLGNAKMARPASSWRFHSHPLVRRVAFGSMQEDRCLYTCANPPSTNNSIR